MRVSCRFCPCRGVVAGEQEENADALHWPTGNRAAQFAAKIINMIAEFAISTLFIISGCWTGFWVTRGVHETGKSPIPLGRTMTTKMMTKTNPFRECKSLAGEWAPLRVRLTRDQVDMCCNLRDIWSGKDELCGLTRGVGRFMTPRVSVSFSGFCSFDAASAPPSGLPWMQRYHKLYVNYFIIHAPAISWPNSGDDTVYGVSAKINQLSAFLQSICK